MTRDEYVAAIEAAFVSIMKQLLVKWAVAQLPWLATGFFNSVLTGVVGLLAPWLGKQAEIRAFIIYSDFRVDSQGRDFLSAAQKFQQSGSLEDEKAFIVASDKFISFVSDGSSSG